MTQMKNSKPWTLAIHERGDTERVILDAVFRLYHGATPEDLRGMTFGGDEEFPPFTDEELHGRYAEVANAADSWFQLIVERLPEQKRKAATSSNALFRHSEGIGDPYMLALGALAEGERDDLFRRKVRSIGSHRYFALVAARCLKSGATRAALEALLFAHEAALSKARASSSRAEQVVSYQVERKKAQSAAAREASKRARADGAASRRATAREVAADYLELHGVLESADRLVAHVAQKTGSSPATVRRWLGPIKNLRAEMREQRKKEREQQIRSYGGLRG